MGVKPGEILSVIYPPTETVRGRRFTQDTPITPDVWVAFAEKGNPDLPIELLLTPHTTSDVPSLVAVLAERLRVTGVDEDEVIVAYNESHVLADLTLRQLLRCALPLSEWWRRAGLFRVTADPGEPGQPSPLSLEATIKNLRGRSDLLELLFDPARLDAKGVFPEELLHFLRIASAVASPDPLPQQIPENHFLLLKYFRAALKNLATILEDLPTTPAEPLLWAVFRNRQATSAIRQSRLAVKADAAVRLFDISCASLRWAVIDSGIDATHPAFQRATPIKPGDSPPQLGAVTSRVIRTYDFTRFKELLSKSFVSDSRRPSEFDRLPLAERQRIRTDLTYRLQRGLHLDWRLLEPLLRVPDAQYSVPENEHGTHVAGVIGADWRKPLPPVGWQPDASWSE